MNRTILAGRCCLAMGMLTGALACGPSAPPRDTSIDAEYTVPALRFAGVDLKYALRRVAGSAGLPILIDELNPPPEALKGQVQGMGQDIRAERVDIDLPAGDLGTALEALFEVAPGFDYRVERGLMIVRSQRVLATRTALDFKDLPAASLEADFHEMIKWVMQNRPFTFLATGGALGHPTGLKVKFEIAEKSSVLEAIAEFARASKKSMLIRRAGYPIEVGPQGPKQVSIASTTVEMMDELLQPRLRSHWRERRGVTRDLAHLAKREKAVVCVNDRSLFFDHRGDLSFRQRGSATGWQLAETLDALRAGRVGRDPSFTWDRNDKQVIRIRSYQFDNYPTGREILAEELTAGRFDGSLPELTRWINKNRKRPSKKLLMGGEIQPGIPTAAIDIPDGMTVEELLYAFAAAAGDGWVYVVRDVRYPHQNVGRAWTGGYLTRLEEYADVKRKS